MHPFHHFINNLIIYEMGWLMVLTIFDQDGFDIQPFGTLSNWIDVAYKRISAYTKDVL